MSFYWAVLLFAFSTTITPGPNNIMIMTSSLNYGVYRSVPHYLGICLGFPLMVAAIGFGLGVIFMQHPMIHQVIKYVGVGYLLWLAWKIANADPQTTSDQQKPLSFFQAALFQWVNVKAWVMAIGAVAAYTAIGSDIAMSVAFIVLAFTLSSFSCVGIWLLFGAILQRVLKRQKQVVFFNRVMALLLVLSIFPMVFEASF